MKAQISRDSFREDKQYSAVYQQQGRMLTDADWNEMVRILKERQDRTVGAAIDSGSPKVGGILSKLVELDEHGNERLDEHGHKVLVVDHKWKHPQDTHLLLNKLNWGRVYVNGMYGHFYPADKNFDPDSPVSLEDFIKLQRDYPKNPAEDIGAKLDENAYYVAYVDLWERLVVALEDEKHLSDPALHGADTCVRTQTMSQLKLAKLEASNRYEAIEEVRAEWEAKLSDPKVSGNEKPLNPRGDATLNLANNVTDNGETSVNKKNALFRLELHESSSDFVKPDLENPEHEIKEYTVILKWSVENGAEQRSNQPDGTDPDYTGDPFWSNDYVYECYSDYTEKHMGQHLLEGETGWKPQKAELYTLERYKTQRQKTGTPAQDMPYVRRWDGYKTLKRLEGEPNWSEPEPKTEEESESETELKPEFGSQLEIKLITGNWEGIPQKLEMKSTRLNFTLELSTVSAIGNPNIFITGDYWYVLLRDKGNGVTAEVLSAEPVGIHHHYLVLGVFKFTQSGEPYIALTPQQWRRLSFPNLTNLTLDHVLVPDENGAESSVYAEIKKRVKKAGDTMTGPLEFSRAEDKIGMTLSTHKDKGASIQFDPSSGPLLGGGNAWIRAKYRESFVVDPGPSPGPLPVDPLAPSPLSPPTVGVINQAPLRYTELELGVSESYPSKIIFNGKGDILLDAKQKVGIGTAAPDAKLEIRSTTKISGSNTADFYAEKISNGENPSHIHHGKKGDWYIRSADITGKVVLQDKGGNVGIGTTTNPGEKLEIKGRVKSDALTIGSWPANAANYVFFGTNKLDQAQQHGNYALLVRSTGGDKGRTYLNSPVDIRFRINNLDKMVLANNGHVGIGTRSPDFPLSFKKETGDKISLYRDDSGSHYGLGIDNSLLQIQTSGPHADIAFGYGNSSNFTETMRIKGDGEVHMAGKLTVDGTITGNLDGTAENANTLDGKDSSEFAEASHNHSGYLRGNVGASWIGVVAAGGVPVEIRNITDMIYAIYYNLTDDSGRITPKQYLKGPFNKNIEVWYDTEEKNGL